MSSQFLHPTSGSTHHEAPRDAPFRGAQSSPNLHSIEGSILTLDANISTVRVGLLEPVNQRYRLLGQQAQPRETERLLSTQFATLATQMGDKLGRTLWDAHKGEPLLQSANHVQRPPIEHVVGSVTLRPWLRVWLAGLSNQGSVAAARQMVHRGPIQIVGQTVLQASANVSDIGVALAASAPDMLILCGGYDVEQRTIQDSAMRLAELLTNALNRLAPAQHPTVLYAGNRLAAAAVEQIFRTQIPTIRFQIVENLLPRPGQVHYASLLMAMEQEELRLNRRMPDHAKILQWLTGSTALLSTESAFVRFVRAWMVLEQLDEIHALYATPQRWMHVRALQTPDADPAEEVEIYFAAPDTRPAALAGWPMVKLTSGAWPEELWPRPPQSWWDRQALAPVMAALGQIAPHAMQQVLAADMF